MRRRIWILFVLADLFIGSAALPAVRSLAAPPSGVPTDACVGGVTAGAVDQGVSATGSQKCELTDPGSPGIAPGTPAPITKWIDCGPPGGRGRVLADIDPACRGAINTCANQQATDAAGRSLTTMVELRQNPDGSWTVASTNCAVVVGPATVTPEMARQEVLRLVPRPAVGVAPPSGRSLVNIQTVLWADTAADRPLGTVTLLGHRVALRVHVQQVAWDFGDGATATATTPGKAYDSAGDPCRTKLCPSYFGHVYATTGTMTVTARVTWSGQFQVDGGTWQDIAGPVTGPAANTPVTVVEARGVLVPPPGYETGH